MLDDLVISLVETTIGADDAKYVSGPVGFSMLVIVPQLNKYVKSHKIDDRIFYVSYQAYVVDNRPGKLTAPP
eukprot:scaffold276207_cov18-Prasinocladus_malaysianus.AAC.1